MKHFLELNQDYIIKTGFKPNYVLGENNRSVVDWVDKESSLANGTEYVDMIYLIKEELDIDGNLNELYRKISFKKDDILKLADKIKEIEYTALVGTF